MLVDRSVIIDSMTLSLIYYFAVKIFYLAVTNCVFRSYYILERSNSIERLVDFMTHEQFKADITAYRGMVYRLAFNCMGNHFDADDVTQETFLRIYRHKKPFVNEEHKRAFLVRVAINLCKDMQKSAWFRKRSVLDNNLQAAQNKDESESVLQEHILKLKPNYRAVIFLFYYEEFTITEIAKILKISETAVTTRLNRARNQLRSHFEINKEAIFHE